MWTNGGVPSGIGQLPRDDTADTLPIMQPASGKTASRRHQIGALDQTALAALAATRIEGAPFRNFGEARHSAVDLGQPIGAMAEAGNRAHQALRVRVLRLLDHLANGADLGDT